MNRENLNLNINKIKEEERRFLLFKNSSEILFNQQGNMHNRLMAISIFAIFIAIASFILNSQYNTPNQKLFVIVVLSILSIYLIYLFVVSSLRIRRQNEIMIRNYDELFKIHFNYAKKGGDKTPEKEGLR